MSNHMPNKMWDEINYPFPNFNGYTDMDNYFHLTVYWTRDYLSMIRLKLNQVVMIQLMKKTS